MIIYNNVNFFAYFEIDGEYIQIQSKIQMILNLLITEKK